MHHCKVNMKILLLPVFVIFVFSGQIHANQTDTFSKWLATFRLEAVAQGISKKTLDQAFTDIKLLPRVVELDRRQPEFTLSFWGYINKSVSTTRIERGERLLRRHKTLLSAVSRKYNIQPRFLVAFWGLETNFGAFTGSFPLIASLTTLAYDKRRSKFFRKQLISALKIIDDGHISLSVKSSWAGAMGNMQFIPTTYEMYAVDGDRDGVRDLWTSLPDIFSSAANYLSKSGWDGKNTWGSEVKLPKNFDLGLTGLKQTHKLSEWSKLGVRFVPNSKPILSDVSASLILPAGYLGPAFLVYENFRSILKWNRSIFYAIAVGHLSDRIDGYGAFHARPLISEIPISISDIKSIQRLLASKGFDAGEPDGIIGSRTREAIRAYQKNYGLPTDGFASKNLLKRLKNLEN